MNRDERIVVVGGGLTGLRAAERLRELKFEGDITILGDEKLPPYHRPALSKQLLKGELRSSDLTLPAYEDLNARWRFGTQVRQLIPNKKTLVLPGGEEMTYDGLIIATGVEATRQSGVPYHDPRVLVLRTMSDGMDLERVIGSTKGRVAVIGGGFTGCELAASLRHLSRDVTLIGRGKNLLGNVLGPDLGEWLTNTHREHGVDLALGNSVEEWAPGPEGIALKLTDGTTLLVSCVILAAGTKPMTHWLRGSGLPLDNGVVCEPTCHVVGADDVVAAGDVAQWPNLRFDNVPRRVEHWLNAVEMGRAAAESLLAGRAAAQPFTPMPRFWTDQYSFRIQAAGMLKLGKDIVKLGTPDEGTGTVYGFSAEGRLMGVVGVDCPSAMIAWAESVSRQNPEPRTKPEIEEPSRPAIAASASQNSGSFSKKRPGKHLAPAQGKQFQQASERHEPEIGFVDHPPAPAAAEISGPIGVGAGRVPLSPGAPRSVVDSFSRMLPVAVRPPNAGPPPNGRGHTPVGGRTLPVAGGPMHSGPISRPATSGPFPIPQVGPSGPINAPFGDGVSHSGAFRTANGNGRPTNGHQHNGVPATQFGGPRQNRPALGPGTGHAPPVPPMPPVPEFSAAEMTDVGGLPEPLSGRLGPNSGLAIDVTGQMALLDANGHVRTPEFSDVPPHRGPSDSFGAMPPVSRGGPSDSFSSVPPIRRAQNGTPVARGPEESFSRMPAVRGPQDSFRALPPARGPEVSSNGMPPARRAEVSSNGMPPARRAEVPSSGMPPARRAEVSSSGMPPARRAEASFGGMPPVRGPEVSSSGMPPARRAEASFGGMPPVRRAETSSNGMPPARHTNGARGPQDSFSRLPAVRASEASSGGMPPARRTNGHGPSDSFSALPPARPTEDSFDTMVSEEGSFGSMPPVSRGGRRAKEDSFDTIVGTGQSDRRAAHRAEDLTPEFGRPPARRRRGDGESGRGRHVPAMSSVDDSIEMPVVRMPKHGRPEDYGAVPSARGGPEDSYDHMPAVERPRAAGGGRRRARA
jgi:NADPH-dependent 2,4-dienoyl-CoA reductase/sulfur reductase-like enzyme